MVGTGEDLMKRINKEQVKAGGGLHFLGGKKKKIFRRSYKEKKK